MVGGWLVGDWLFVGLQVTIGCFYSFSCLVGCWLVRWVVVAEADYLDGCLDGCLFVWFFVAWLDVVVAGLVSFWLFNY